MNYQDFNAFCKTLPASNHVVQWGGSHVWKVANKVFAIGGWQKNDAEAFTFKTSDMDFHILSDTQGYRPAPYFANRGMKWIQHIEESNNLDNDLKYYITESHRLVSLGLSKTKQKELGLNQN